MRATKAGFTLVEILVWIVTLMVVTGLLVGALISMEDAGRSAMRSVDSGATATRVLKHVGADVRCSSAIVIEAGPYQSGKETLILEDPGKNRVVYHNEDGCLYRISGVGGEERRIPIGRVKSLTFSYAPGGAGGSRWVRIELGGKKTPTLSARFALMSPTVSGGRTGGDR